jgi:Protein of unknown function (DUF2723)
MLAPLNELSARARRVRGAAGALLVTAIGAAVFWRTSYPTIHWWDSAEYSLAAGTLGVVGPPGSLLLTLLGWPVARLPVGSSPAHLLNLLAGALAGVTTGLVYVIAVGLLRFTELSATEGDRRAMTTLGAALGAWTFAFGATLWEYAVQFTPYVLSAVFAALILWVMLRWWKQPDHPDAWRSIALLGLLFGLDFSVHRTNAMLLPGALVWILLRHPRTLRAPKTLLGGTVGLLVGLALQLLIIPIGIGATTRSPLFWDAPTNWSGFWDYASMTRLGGGFLVQLSPRKAAIWSVQVSDFLGVLGANFFHWNGPTGVLGVVPAAAALLGLTTLWRRDRRLGIGYTLVLFLQAAMTVLFLNIPANFFRTFDRHYLPVCVTIAVLMSYGFAITMGAAAQLSLKWMRLAAVAVGILVVLVPLSQVIGNWTRRDASKRYVTKEFATTLLTTLPRDAILFTVGDNDTFPLLYFQAVEGVRRDVTIINLAVANLPAFPDELLRRDPSFPLTLSSAERAGLSARGSAPETITIPVTGSAESLGLPIGAKPPTAVTVSVKPQSGTKLLPADISVMDIVRTNRWRRPVCFATTGTPSMGWLAPYGRIEGLYYRIVPTLDPPTDIRVLRANLLAHADYRNYADPTVQLDGDDRTFGLLSHLALTRLLEADRKSGDVNGCRTDAAALFAAVPPERMALPAGSREKTLSECNATR